MKATLGTAPGASTVASWSARTCCRASRSIREHGRDEHRGSGSYVCRSWRTSHCGADAFAAGGADVVAGDTR
jgi:hypothetical protein